MLHLVRHGQSTWNVEGRLQGQVMHVPLTDLGRRQAREAADRLASRVGTELLLFSSDQARALETATVIGGRLGIPVHTSQLLREQGLGRMEGRLAREIADWPQPEAPSDADISEVSWHGAETVEEVWHRARAALDAIMAAGAADVSDVVVVSHGTFLQVLDAVLDARSHREVDWDHMPANGEVVSRAWRTRAASDGHGVGGARVSLGH